MPRAELSRAAGIHHNTLERIESGKSQPEPDTLQRIVAALGTSLSVVESLIPHLSADGRLSVDALRAWSGAQQSDPVARAPQHGACDCDATAAEKLLGELVHTLPEPERLDVLAYALEAARRRRELAASA